MNTGSLARAFFWFGLVCGLFAVFTQYGFTYQVGSQRLFADPVFYLLLGGMSMMAGIFVNTEKSGTMF
jgi:hypothetical protein